MIGSKLVREYIPADKNNYTLGREGKGIQKITLHHMAARWTAARLGEAFQNPGRQGSSHYGIGYEGEIAQYVGEENTAWTDGNWESNLTSITIECANSSYGAPWPVSEKTIDSLVLLLADIAKRYGFPSLVKGENLSWHQMFSATACPGEYLLGRIDEILERANALLWREEAKPETVSVSYQVYTGSWLPEVSGYNTADSQNGYAGNMGEPISGVYATLSSGDVFYKVHQKGGAWLPQVKNREDWAGNLGFVIDGFMIRSPGCDLFYRVHTVEGGWLPEVSGYSESDPVFGFAGNFGQSIDAIMIRAVSRLPEAEAPPEAETPPEVEAPPEAEAPPKVEAPQKKRNLLIRFLSLLRDWIDSFLSRLG